MVHSGTVDFGHYTCYLRPDNGEDWFKVDDATVTLVREYDAIEGNFGGYELDSCATRRFRTASAYLLIYVRKTDASRIVYAPRDDERPVHLRRRYEEEKATSKLKEEERIERSQHVMLVIVTEDHIREHVATEVGGVCSTVKVPAEWRVKIPKSCSVGDVRARIEEAGGPKANCMRLWHIRVKREIEERPGWTVGRNDVQTIERVASGSGVRKDADGYAELAVYAECRPPDDELWLPFPQSQALVLVKRYDPFNKEQPWSFCGNFISTITEEKPDGPELSRVCDVTMWVNKMLGRPSDAPMAIWEEDDFEHEAMKPLNMPEKLLWKDLTISTGSKVVVMLAETPEEVDWLFGLTETCPERLSMPLANPQAYIDDFLARMTEEVNFIPLPSDDASGSVTADAAASTEAPLPTVTLQLLRTAMYPQLQEALAPELGLSDPSLLRFTRHSNWAEGPEKVPIKTTDERQLRSGDNAMLQDKSRVGDRKHKLYYEKLDRPVSVMEAIVNLNVEVRDQSMQVLRPAEPTLTMPDKESCSARGIIEAALAALPEGQALRKAKPEDMVLLLVKDSTIADQFGPSTDVLDSHFHHWLYRVEPKAPESEEGECLMQCVHISPLEGYSRPVTHSQPFYLVVHEADTEVEVRESMKKKLGFVDGSGKTVGKEDGSTWNIHLLSQSSSETRKLESGPEAPSVVDQVADILGARRAQWSMQPVLAFEHPAPPAARRGRRSQEEAVRFKSTTSTEGSRGTAV